MWIYTPYLVIGIINSFGVISYSITSFGLGIIYQLGWSICQSIDDDVCCGGMSTAVVHVTVAAFLIAPSQLYLLRNNVNWYLAFNIVIFQQLGLFLGVYTLFHIESVWFSRSLGLLIFLLSLHLIIGGKRDQDKLKCDSMVVIDPNSYNKTDGESIVMLDWSDKHSNSNNEYVSTTVEDINGDTRLYYEINSWDQYLMVWLTGATSGVLSGLFATGGPPMMLFISYAKLNSVEARATVTFCDCCNNLGRMIFIIFLHTSYSLQS